APGLLCPSPPPSPLLFSSGSARARLRARVPVSRCAGLRTARFRPGCPRLGAPLATVPAVSTTHVRLVAAPDVAAHGGALLDRADPRVEVARQLGITVVAIRGQRAQRGRILPGLENEDAVVIVDIERRCGGEAHDDIAPRQLGHSDLRLVAGGSMDDDNAA